MAKPFVSNFKQVWLWYIWSASYHGLLLPKALATISNCHKLKRRFKRESMMVYFVLMHILKDIPRQQIIVILCSWHTTKRILLSPPPVFISRTQTNSRSDSLHSFLSHLVVANWPFLPLIKTISLTSGWLCILKQSSGSSKHTVVGIAEPQSAWWCLAQDVRPKTEWPLTRL